ncbi:MAG: hypothetical protein WCF84_24260 [Anaerolineae bacterium]
MDTPLTPEASNIGWPFSITGVPLVTPTPAPNETLTPVHPSGNAVFADCAPQVDKEITFPERFAPNFPFPPQTKFFKVATLNNNPNYVEVVGYAPLNFKDSVRYLLAELPQAGYTLGRGDAEGAEAESFFDGNGWRGGFRVNEIFYCPDVTEWVVIVFKF